jgi:hypothetical protein
MMHMKYKHSFTFLLVMIAAWVLATFAFVQFSLQPIANNWQQLLTFLLVVIVVWVAGTFALIYFWPRLMLLGIKRLVTQRGVDANSSSGVPVNTLYAVPNRASPQGTSKILTTGTDDVLYVFGWLDLAKGPQVLHVPDFAGRYYSVQFTDPSDGANFAYVGTRTTGTQAGDYLITGPGWKGQVPGGTTQIPSPNNSLLVIGRVLVQSDSDLSTAYDLSKQIQLTRLGGWQPGQPLP